MNGQRRENRRVVDIDTAGHHLDQRLGRALEGDRLRLESGAQAKTLHGHVDRAADTDRSECDRPLLSFGDQLLHGLDVFGRRDDQDIGQISERRDRDKILDRIVLQVGDRGRRDDMSRGMGQQRVAVGIRPGHRARGDRAACARPVFDNDRLAELGRHLLENNSWNDVGRASRAQRDDRADGPAWPLIGAADGDAGKNGACDGEDQGHSVAHVGPLKIGYISNTIHHTLGMKADLHSSFRRCA